MKETTLFRTWLEGTCVWLHSFNFLFCLPEVLQELLLEQEHLVVFWEVVGFVFFLCKKAVFFNKLDTWERGQKTPDKSVEIHCAVNQKVHPRTNGSSDNSKEKIDLFR